MAAPAPESPTTASESFIVPSESLEAVKLDASSPQRPASPATEKQGLLEALEQAHAALARSRSENDDLKEQLEASNRQVQDQADQIAMLRGKVEEARRGVMRLQTENRRQSQLQLANAQEGGVGLRSSKRASFILPPTPASPGGSVPSAGKHIHRRISSMSDPGLHDKHAPTASPPSFLTAFPDNISGRITPPTPTGPTLEEFAALKAELAGAQLALQEATDAREASETAVRALREFIAENAVGESKTASGSSDGGLQGLRLPPLPTDADVADEEASASRKPEEPKRGWGGWLKRESSNTVPKTSVRISTPSIKSATEEEEAPASTPATSTPLTSFVSSWTKAPSTTNIPEASPASPVVPPQQLSGFRKFSLFGRSAPAAAATVPASEATTQRDWELQTHCEPEPEHEHEEPAKHVPPPLELSRDRNDGSVRDSVSSASVSDAVEPVSPPAELVDVALEPGHRMKGQEEFAGERTPTVASVTGFAM
ncbi:hypothetical protein RhiJN_02017 [Ceratobasidium sp. AG-Ba]|nr:hypothetical protein RhiJN_02017 [Ceratobasidium sp. AG-Ba]QRW02952.1 hypothetical protein RhiLY_01951 [Ceratobasidium sp. AG-Ba]